MTRKERLLELAKRCEEINGIPPRKLDADISAALKYVPEEYRQDWIENWGGEWRGSDLGRVTLMDSNGDKGPHWMSPHWSRSLDAVAVLEAELLPDMCREVLNYRDDYDEDSMGIYICSLRPEIKDFPIKHHFIVKVEARTEPLARLAALLRALAEMETVQVEDDGNITIYPKP